MAWFDPSTPGAAPWVNLPIPNAAEPNSLMAFFWQDLVWQYDAATNKGVTNANLTSGGIPSAKLIEYDDAHVYGDTSQTYDVEFIVYGDGFKGPGGYEIIYAYDNIVGGLTTGTIGVENQTGTAGTQFAYDDAALATVHDGMAICFVYVPPTTPTTITYEVTIDAGTLGLVTNSVEHEVDNPGSEVMMTSFTLFSGYKTILPLIYK